jgi:hypothetical protein
MATKQLTFLPQGLVSLYQPFYLCSTVVSTSVFIWIFLCCLSPSCQLNLRDIVTISGQRPLSEAHLTSLLSIWGDSLSNIQNTNLDYALVVIKEGQDAHSRYLCVSGQHRIQVLLRRIAQVKRIDWTSASHEEEAKWVCHVFNKGMFYLCFGFKHTHCFPPPQDLLSAANYHLQRALMVMQNTPDHVLQSTVLEKASAFVDLAKDIKAQPEELEVFYHHLRGNITSNYFLECAFHSELACVLHNLNTLLAFQGIPHLSLKTWTRAGPNDCHAAGVSLYLCKQPTLLTTISPDMGCCVGTVHSPV